MNLAKGLARIAARLDPKTRTALLKELDAARDRASAPSEVPIDPWTLVALDTATATIREVDAQAAKETR
jgi:hypothetical protein